MANQELEILGFKPKNKNYLSGEEIDKLEKLVKVEKIKLDLPLTFINLIIRTHAVLASKGKIYAMNQLAKITGINYSANDLEAGLSYNRRKDLKIDQLIYDGQYHSEFG